MYTCILFFYRESLQFSTAAQKGFIAIHIFKSHWVRYISIIERVAIKSSRYVYVGSGRTVPGMRGDPIWQVHLACRLQVHKYRKHLGSST